MRVSLRRASRLGVVLIAQGSCAQQVELLQQLDTNGDGRLSRSEFRPFSRSTVDANGQLRDGLGQRQHFDSIDVDGDGSISLTEFGAAVSGGSAPNLQDAGDAAMATIQHFDQDGDEQLSREELAVMLSMSHNVDASQLDADGDGYITHEELRSSIEASQPR